MKCTIINILLIFLLISCSNQKGKEITNETSNSGAPHKNASEQNDRAERTPLPFDSLFTEFTYTNPFLKYELLSYRNDPEILYEGGAKLFKVNYDRTCLLEYAYGSRINRLMSNQAQIYDSKLVLEANNPEFEIETMPISKDDGLIYYDAIKGYDIYNRDGKSFKKTLSVDFGKHVPSSLIVRGYEKKISTYFKDKEGERTIIKTYNYFNDKPLLIDTVDMLPFQIKELSSSGLYLSEFRDKTYLHFDFPSSKSRNKIDKYKIPYRIGEVYIYSSDHQFKKYKKSLFGGTVIHELATGMASHPYKRKSRHGIFYDEEGIKFFEIVNDKLVSKGIELNEGESRSSRLFASRDYVGNIIFETKTPGVLSNDISNHKLLLYSLVKEEVYEIRLPDKLKGVYDILSIENHLYIFNDEVYYVCDLDL